MRESIGGTMLFWIVLFFMSVFIAFMASVIKYARVYKIKNTIPKKYKNYSYLTIVF